MGLTQAKKAAANREIPFVVKLSNKYCRSFNFVYIYSTKQRFFNNNIIMERKRCIQILPCLN